MSATLRKAIREYLKKIPTGHEENARRVVNDLRVGLNAGTIRAAERGEDGTWVVNTWVKEGILLGFRLGTLRPIGEGSVQPYFDKDSWPVKPLTLGHGVRVVPGGTSIRDGSYVAPGVVVIPPSFINVGAYVDAGTMVDSHALLGSCAQIGKRVHISAGAQVGGVLEPAGAMPVIVEDDVMLGGNTGVFEGTIIRERAVLAPGTILSGGTVVYDLVRDATYRRDGETPLEIPAGAVVVPGTRPVKSGPGKKLGIALYAPVIVKYRDEKTDAALQLEDLLR